MKKIKIEKKLSLSKETITKLNDSQMNNVVGGVPNTTMCPTNQSYRWSNCINCYTIGSEGGSNVAACQ